MNYVTIQPPASLAEFVRFFWVLESDLDSYVHRSMAEVCCEMVFHYKGIFTELKEEGKSELSFTSGVQAPSDQIKRFSIDRSFGIFGVYFFPYAIPLLTKTSANEMVNQMIDLKTLLGKEGSMLEEQIMLAASISERITIITDFLEKRLCSNASTEPVFKAMRKLIDARGNIKIAQLAHDHAMSERQFERKFKTYSGFNPKLFARIIRFHNACSQYDNKRKSLTDIALDCGYYDQSHFIHEFKQFSGHHPKLFFSGQAEGTEWRQ